MKFIPAVVVACGLVAVSSLAQASCGSAFCMVNTNWNLQGHAPEKGLRVDFRFEYIDQDQPMAGDNRVGVGEISRHHDEVRTVNRNYVFTLDYNFDDAWGISATIPFVDRSHFHIHHHHGAQLPEQWNFSEPGDVRVVGQRQWAAQNLDSARTSYYGINVGLKLPTGEVDIENDDGERAERTLQPGTGTTDLLLGAYYSRLLLDQGSSWFIQGLVQAALNSHDDFKPGEQVSIDLGYRYEASDSVGLMLQLNLFHRARDRGAEAEPDDSGGNAVYISPGVGYAIAKRAQLYGFVQLPFYQYVNGVQLTADWSALLGINLRF